ncbi:MAG: hypothetical protein KIT84_32515 [Labilithrix sp.]|nr:hypothetical protein [Labilithrix sp.]MCW5815798.1 hypothetical protein [Labilithrix sp.]
MRRQVGFWLSLLIAAPVVVACSADPIVSAESPVAADNSGAANESGAKEGVCGALEARRSACTSTSTASTCDGALASACGAFDKILSPAAAKALSSCSDAPSCTASPFACLGENLSKLEPSDAQRSLAKAYCSSCSPVSGAVCESELFGASSPLANLVLPLGDDFARALESSCTGTPACGATFAVCAQTALAKLVSDVDPAAVKCFGEALVGSTPSTPSTPDATPAPSPAPAPSAQEQERTGTVRVKIDGEEMEIASVTPIARKTLYCDDGIHDRHALDPDYVALRVDFRDKAGVESNIHIHASATGTGCSNARGLTGTLKERGNWLTGDWHFASATADCGLTVDALPSDIAAGSKTPGHFKAQFSGPMTTGWAWVVAPTPPQVEIDIDITVTPWVLPWKDAHCTNVAP